MKKFLIIGLIFYSTMAFADSVGFSNGGKSAVTGPLTDTELRATPVPVSGTITAENPTNLEGGGSGAVGVTAVEVTFTATPTRSIIISSAIANTGILYIGKSDVTNLGANAFAFLQAGDSVSIDYDDASNAIYVVSDTAAQSFFKGAVY